MLLLQLIISYYMNAQAMGEFSKEEWTSGLVKLSCDSIESLKKKLPELRAELKCDAKFKEIYSYAYQFSREKGQKCVQLDVALGG